MKYSCAQSAENGQMSLTPAAESDQSAIATISNDEIWHRFKIAQNDLTKLIKEANNENKHRN